MNNGYFEVGDKVRAWNDAKRQSGVVVECHPFGVYQVKWDKFSRPETVLSDNLWLVPNSPTTNTPKI